MRYLLRFGKYLNNEFEYVKDRMRCAQVFFNVTGASCVNSFNSPYAKLDDYYFRVEQEFVEFKGKMTDTSQMPRMNF